MIDKSLEVEKLRQEYNSIKLYLNELTRRIWAGTRARAYGRGGITLVHLATGMSRHTIRKGVRESKISPSASSKRIRKRGGGRKKITELYPTLSLALDHLVDPTSRGDPESHLRWTCKSTPQLAKALNAQGYPVSHVTVYGLLKEQGYSLQSNQKTLEGSSHQDRDAQFKYINQTMEETHEKGQPGISVDTKKKENIGNFKNNGREHTKKGKPRKVNTYDFPDKDLGKAIPYGIYDIVRNEGWVSVGISADTAEFSVNAIRSWWNTVGKGAYPEATELVITADCGGSNGNRTKLWKFELQKFAEESGLILRLRHFPPGTSKWNKIEHRMFSFISMNWRGKPLECLQTVIRLIGSTTTKTGLTIKAVLDENQYEKGRKISDKEMEAIKIKGDAFHPEWNYTIFP